MRTTKLAILAVIASACANDPSLPFGPGSPSPDAGPDAEVHCSSSLTLCGSTCVDLQTDAQHCGACDHSCAGTSCNAGLCEPTKLAQGQTLPSAIAVDASRVYWLTSSAVMAIDKGRPGAAPETLAANTSPSALAVDSSSVYWTDQVAGTVNQVPRLGGIPSTLATNQATPGPIAVVGADLYWGNEGSASSPGGLMKLPAGAATPIRLVSNTSVTSLAATADMVYFEGGYLDAVFASDGTLAFHVSSGGRVAAVDVSNVYFVVSNQLARNPRYHWRIEPLYMGTVGGVASDGAHVYFTDQTLSVYRLAAPGSMPLLLADGQGAPSAIAVDDQFVYWVNRSSGTMMRVGK